MVTSLTVEREMELCEVDVWARPEWQRGASLEISIDLSYSPGCKGKVNGEPEDCYPPEGPEIESSGWDIVGAYDDEGKALEVGALSEAENEQINKWVDDVVSGLDDNDIEFPEPDWDSMPGGHDYY